MWLFTTLGFFSVVHKPRDPVGLLTVRARAADDLDRLREHCRVVGSLLQPTEREPGTDYPFRARIWSEELGSFMAQEIAGINYNNFKDAATASLGRKRVVAFHQVWEVMATQYNGDMRWQDTTTRTTQNPSIGSQKSPSSPGRRKRRSRRPPRHPAL